MVERELQPWTPDTDGPQLMDMSLDSKGTWDQFATNEKLFGVKTDYDEALYTTQLDRNSEQYRKKERDAMRLAREIEKVSLKCFIVLLIVFSRRPIMSIWRRNAVK